MGGVRFRSFTAALLVLPLLFAGQSDASLKREVNAREASAADRFWTPARIAKAVGHDPSFSASGSGLRHRPVNVFRPEVGKILGRVGRSTYSCSGSVIDTSSLRLVLTAAHCLYADGRWSRNVIFIPAYRNGLRPFGIYRSKNLWVPREWAARSYRTRGANFDMGLIVTRKRWDGSRIGENVGALPVQTFPKRRGLTDIYGYPSGRTRARVIRTCRNYTSPWIEAFFLAGPIGMKVRCDMEPGSSGGPWVSRYQRPGGGTVGRIDGLTSTGYRLGRRNYLTSPFFGQILVRMIRSTEGR